MARTPVHIGGTRPLRRSDYVIRGDHLHVISPHAFIEWLDRQRLVAPFNRVVSEGGSIQDFLRAHGGFANVHAFTAYRVRWEGERPRGTVRTFIRDAFGRPIVPGSSIKGALRTTALGERIRSEQHSLVRAVERAISEMSSASPPERRKVRESAAAPLERQQFRVLRWQDPSDRAATDLHRDVWRSVKVADSAPLADEAVRVYPVATWSLRSDGTAYCKAIQFAECLVPGTEIVCDVTFDVNLLRQDGRVGPEALMRALAAWPRDVWGAEREALAQFGPKAGPLAELARFYEREEPASFRLGWGSGWLGLTLAPLLEPEQRLRMRDALFQRREGVHFPKSRRVAMTPSGVLPLGWLDARLEPEER